MASLSCALAQECLYIFLVAKISKQLTKPEFLSASVREVSCALQPDTILIHTICNLRRWGLTIPAKVAVQARSLEGDRRRSDFSVATLVQCIL